MPKRFEAWLFGILGRLSPRGLGRLAWWVEPKFLVAVAMVVRRGDEVLWLRHTYRPRVPWGLPTGFVARGETLEGACRRELWEETGLRVEHWHLVQARLHPRYRRVEVAYWGRIGEDEAPVARGPEIDAVGFWQEMETPEPVLPDQRDLVQCVLTVGDRS